MSRIVRQMLGQKVQAAIDALFDVEIQLRQTGEYLGQARSDDLRSRVFALRIELANVGSKVSFELNAASQAPGAEPTKGRALFERL